MSDAKATRVFNSLKKTLAKLFLQEGEFCQVHAEIFPLPIDRTYLGSAERVGLPHLELREMLISWPEEIGIVKSSPGSKFQREENHEAPAGEA
jgi:hypothetical protein